MAMGFSFVMMLPMLLSSGGNDLLGYIPTEAYWGARGVAVSPQAMIDLLKTEKPSDITALIKDLGGEDFAKRQAAQEKILAMGPAVLPQIAPKVDDADPEVAARAKEIVQKLSSQAEGGAVDKLMAIRTLGELKAQEALDVLAGLADSTEPFVAEYAARAAAEIQGTPIPKVSAAAEDLAKDVLVLPARCGLVAQVAAQGGKNTSLDKLLADMPMRVEMDKQQMVQQFTAMLMEALNKVGNIRADGVTLGLADDIGGHSGFAVVVGRGLYDRAKVKQAFLGMHMQAETIEGMEALCPDKKVVIFMPSDRQIVLVIGPDRAQMPVAEVAAVLSGKPLAATAPATQPAAAAGLAGNPDMLKLIESVSAGQSLWAVARMTDCYRFDPMLKPFDVITLQGRQDGEMLKLKLVAQGKDPQEIRQAVELFNGHLLKAKEKVAEAVQEMPPMKPVADFLDSVKVETADNAATLTAELKGTSLPSAGMMMMFFRFSVARHAGPPGPPMDVEIPVDDE